MTKIIQDPKQIKALRDAVCEASDSLTRIEAEKSLISEIRKKMKEDYGIQPSYFNKMVKTYHKQSFIEDTTQQDEFETIYENVFQINK